MKYLKLFEYAKNESLVDKKTKLIKDLSYDLTDDGFTVNIYKNKSEIGYFDSYFCLNYDIKYIFIIITYKKYDYYLYWGKDAFDKYIKEPKISIDYFNKRVEEFIKDLQSYNLEIESWTSSSWICKIKIKKYGKTPDFIRNY